MIIRLQKYLADSGVTSRRKAEELIADGRVAVNGVIVTTPGVKADTDTDAITVDGKLVAPSEKKVYIMLHKPEGYVTTVSDELGRRTVMDLLKGVEERVFPVGRLDYETSGLLLMTNDGDFAYRLTHPKFKINKVYIARVAGNPTDEELNRLRHGVMIDGQKTTLAKVERLKRWEDNTTTLKITLHEGRNRQVRKMCEAVGHQVLRLKRTDIGRLTLGRLVKGGYEFLNYEVLHSLLGTVKE